MNFNEIQPEIAERLGLSEDGKLARPTKDITDTEVIYLKIFLKELPELQVLDLNGCGRLTEAGVRNLKEALPKCIITRRENGMSPGMSFFRDVCICLVGLFLSVYLYGIIRWWIIGKCNDPISATGAALIFGMVIGNRYYYYFGKMPW